LECLDILLNVDGVLLLEELAEVVSDTLVEIFSSEMGITGGGEHLEDTVVDGEEGDIEGTTTEIEDDDVLLVLLVESVGNSGGGWLVNDSEHIESGDESSVLGGLSLGVVEVGWHGDDSVLDLLTKVVLGDLLHLGEDHGGDFFWGKLLLSNAWHLNLHVWLTGLGHDLVWDELEISLDFLVVELAANEALDDVDGSFWVVGGLVLGRFSDKSLLVSECDDGGSNSVSELVGNDLDATILENSYARVGGSQIDTNDWTIDFTLLVATGNASCEEDGGEAHECLDCSHLLVSVIY